LKYDNSSRPEMKAAYGVSSVGLGHARRSLTLARALRSIRPDIEITWFTTEPVISFLRNEGEIISYDWDGLSSLSSAMENEVASGDLKDISKVARSSNSIAKKNYFELKSKLSDFDLLIQDEYAETMFCFMWDKHTALPKYRVIITDYLELGPGNNLNPLSRIITWYANRMLFKAYENSKTRIFAEEADSVPKSKQKRLAELFTVVGPILPDIPLQSKESLKRRLIKAHFGKEIENKFLVVVSVGGTSTGKYLIDFILSNSRELIRQLSCVFLILLGPRIDYSLEKVTDQTLFDWSNLLLMPYNTTRLLIVSSVRQADPLSTRLRQLGLLVFACQYRITSSRRQTQQGSKKSMVLQN
jgi:hypothetical protein